MPRRIKAIGIGAVLSTSAMAWHGPSINAAAMQVNLAIVESCVVHSHTVDAGVAIMEPDVECLHDAAYRTTFARPAPDQPSGLAKLPSSQMMQLTIWQITF